MNESSGKTEPVQEGGEPTEVLWIQEALDCLTTVLRNKNGDYKIAGEFSNFEFAGAISGVGPGDVMLTQIGIKLGRLKGLSGGREPSNEAVHDTIMDLAGYAVILYAYSLSKQEW